MIRRNRKHVSLGSQIYLRCDSDNTKAIGVLDDQVTMREKSQGSIHFPFFRSAECLPLFGETVSVQPVSNEAPIPCGGIYRQNLWGDEGDMILCLPCSL